MVEKILNNTTPYGKSRASYEGSLHSSTLIQYAVYTRVTLQRYSKSSKHDTTS